MIKVPQYLTSKYPTEPKLQRQYRVNMKTDTDQCNTAEEPKINNASTDI